MKLANVKGDKSVIRLEAKDETPVATKRRRIEEPREVSREDELDVGQPKREEQKSFAETMTRSRRKRGRPKRVLLVLSVSGQTHLNPETFAPARQSVYTDQVYQKSKQAFKNTFEKNLYRQPITVAIRAELDSLFN